LKEDAVNLISAWWRLKKGSARVKSRRHRRASVEVLQSLLGPKSSIEIEIEDWRKKKMGMDLEGEKRAVVVVGDKRLVEVFEKRMETFKGARRAVLTKPIPMNENLARIDTLLDEHSNEMYSTMLLF